MSYPGSAIVCVSGFTAAGKTTHCHLLAGEFGLTYVSASQILLAFTRRSPIQPRDFWLTDEGRRLWSDRMTLKVDAELIRLSESGNGFIFDALAMPWRIRRDCLRIFLESDLMSRVAKSIVSHRGLHPASKREYAAKIREKDRVLIDSHRRLFSMDMASDRASFDLVLDISRAIRGTSFAAARESILTVSAILRAAVGYYLTREEGLFAEYLNALQLYPDYVSRERIREFHDRPEPTCRE